MKDKLWNLTKKQFYEDLAQWLINASNKYEDGTIGWAREENLNVSSPMNTSEALLGLLYSTNIIAHGYLSHEIRSCIKGGVIYLISNQCKTGGWTTSESNNLETAQGNMMSTATAIWSIVEYVLLHGDSDEIRECLKKSLYFIKSCKITNCVYKFRPSVDKNSTLSTLYALMGLINLNIYYAENEDKTMLCEISKMVNDIITNYSIDKSCAFENMFMLLIVKKIG